MKTRIIANFPDDDGSGLTPLILSIPEWLPNNSVVARKMVNDISEYYCSDAWVLDDETSWKSNKIKSLFLSMDWSDVETLEYDWTEKSSWGGLAYDPFDIWLTVGTCKRSREIESLICENIKDAEKYAKMLPRESWHDWTAEELMLSPCWMFYYAKNVCKGRLPELLDNAMMMKSFEDSDNHWIKRYFGTKRYRVRNRKALSAISWAA